MYATLQATKGAKQVCLGGYAFFTEGETEVSKLAERTVMAQTHNALYATETFKYGATIA